MDGTEWNGTWEARTWWVVESRWLVGRTVLMERRRRGRRGAVFYTKPHRQALAQRRAESDWRSEQWPVCWLGRLWFRKQKRIRRRGTGFGLSSWALRVLTGGRFSFSICPGSSLQEAASEVHMDSSSSDQTVRRQESFYFRACSKVLYFLLLHVARSKMGSGDP